MTPEVIRMFVWLIIALCAGYALHMYQPVIIEKVKAKFNGVDGE